MARRRVFSRETAPGRINRTLLHVLLGAATGCLLFLENTDFTHITFSSAVALSLTVDACATMLFSILHEIIEYAIDGKRGRK